LSAPSNMRTICLLTAGLGTRMGKYAEMTNKTLLPINGKAIISHIIDQYPVGPTRFVVALGHKGSDVQTYLTWAHPHLRHAIDYVWVDNYAGPGSGPAYSVRQCQEVIGEDEFTLITCDGYYECLSSIPTGRNVLGVARVDPSLQSLYCNVQVEQEKIVAIYDKHPTTATQVAACGVYHIADTDTFFHHLQGTELSSGFAALPMGAVEIFWRDLGSDVFYDAFVQEQFGSESFDYSKENELLYVLPSNSPSFPKKRVIKFFANRDITEHRVVRAQARPQFPAIDGHNGSFYTYPFVDGHTLYQQYTPAQFSGFLEWLETQLWNQVPKNLYLTSDECAAFYWTKTQERLAQFRAKYPDYHPSRINGTEIRSTLEEALQTVNWSRLCHDNLIERTAFIHGDLQFDNIVVTPTGDLCLLDWRQDFAGQLWHGDKYYDLAKLKAGLILNHDLIKRRAFFYDEHDREVVYDVAVRQSHTEMLRILESRYPSPIIDDIVSLIFLNMAPLHKAPYDRLLFALALRRLASPL